MSSSDCLDQGIAFHTQSLSNRRCLQARVEHFLGFLQDLGSQHRRTPSLRFLIKPRHALLPVALHGPLDTDQRHAKGTRYLRLGGVSINTKLSGNHAKGRNIILGMNKYRHASIEVSHLAIAFLKSQLSVDVLHAIRKKRQLHLWH